jgi:hypothetical protein
MADNNSNYSQYILPIGLLLGGGLVLQKFGLLPSAESKAQDKALEQLDELAAFKRGYAATIAKGRPARQVLLTAAKALAVAAMLKKAKGIFNDDESAVYSAFKEFKTQSQLAQVAQVFIQEYNTNLLEYLNTFLNDKERARVYSLINKLPTGITIL